jgi:hypothetical protein
MSHEPSVVEIIVRLPSPLPTDDSFHGFPLPIPWSEGVPAAVREVEQPIVGVTTVSVPAPWVRPEDAHHIMRGLQSVVGQEALPTPQDIDSADQEAGPDPIGASASTETWMVVRSAMIPLEGEEDLDPLTAILGRGLIGLNRIIRALAIVRPRSPYRPIFIEDLDQVGFWRPVADDGATGQIAYFPVSPRLDDPRSTRPLDDDELKTLNHLIDLQGQHHPFTTHRDWFNSAEHERAYTGDTAAAVVALQTCVESLVTNLVHMLRVDEGEHSGALLAKERSAPSFKGLLRSELHTRLQGNWNTDHGPVGEYWADLYQLRNLVVHNGYRPTYAEMERAFRVYNALMDHIGRRLRANSQRYPRTFFSLFGIDGIERRGWMSNALRRIAEALREEECFFWLPADLAGR